MSLSINRVKVRTLFISDTHLGMKGCQAELLVDFLRHHEAETIYLVGDIVEGWRLKSTRPWPRSHLDVASELLIQARNGSRIIYVPGNHDDFAREFVGLSFGGIEIVRQAIHEGVDGRRYLVIHGDQFDLVMQHAKWLAILGHWGYHTLLALNTYVNMARHQLGLNYWSLSAWAKHQVKKVMTYISQFEESLAAEAKRNQAQGVVCGHIHHAADHDRFGVRYINAGDWVESCTGVLEHYDGRFEIAHWAGAPQPSSIGRTALARFRNSGRWIAIRPAGARGVLRRD